MLGSNQREHCVSVESFVALELNWNPIVVTLKVQVVSNSKSLDSEQSLVPREQLSDRN